MWQEILNWFASITVNSYFKTDFDINMADDRGWTPLHHAVDQDHIGVVNALIEHGANVNAVDNDGCTPLHYAIPYYHSFYGNIKVEIANTLIKHGANVNAVDKEGYTLLHCAIRHHLSRSVVHKTLETVKALIEHGADMSAVCGNAGWTPLTRAVFCGHTELVKLLMERGANINVIDNDGWAPLHYAIRDQHIEIAHVLIEAGANVNVADRLECTPLHYAVDRGQLEIINKLIAKGAYVNVLDNRGWTPLHEAVNRSYIGILDITIIETLIRKGADPLLKSMGGRTSMGFDIRNQNVLKVIKAEREKCLEQEKIKRMLVRRFHSNNVGKISKLFPRYVGDVVVSLILEKLSLQDLDNLIKVVLNDDIFQMLDEIITDKLTDKLSEVQNNNYYTILNELENIAQDREEEYRKLNQENQNPTGKLSEAMVKQVYTNEKAM